MQAYVNQASSRHSLKVVAWIAVMVVVALAILGSTTATVSAVAGTTLHQTPPIGWQRAAFQGTEEECAEVDLASGQVLWHFVLVQTDADTAWLTATFKKAGVVQVQSYKQSDSVLHFAIITGKDKLLAAETDAVGRWLNLSHICSNITTTTSSSSSSSSTTSEQ